MIKWQSHVLQDCCKYDRNESNCLKKGPNVHFFSDKYVSELYKYDQPLAIRKIIRNTSKNERTRIHDDKSKIKMKNNFKAGQCMFNLIDTWNKTKKQYRMAGNLWSLKKMIKEETLNEIKPCTEKKCYMCNLDKHVNYESRMQQ